MSFVNLMYKFMKVTLTLAPGLFIPPKPIKWNRLITLMILKNKPEIKPLNNNYENIEKLFQLKDAISHTDESDKLFFLAMKESLIHHYNNSPVYRELCKKQNFSIENLKTEDDLCGIPSIFVDIFKKYDLVSVPRSEIDVTYTSSGTTGQKSHISWDKGSRLRQESTRGTIMNSFGLVGAEPVNYFCFTYGKDVSHGRGAARAHEAYTQFAPAKEKFFAIHADSDNNSVFDVNECIDKFREFSETDLSLRIIGFPAFLSKTLDEMVRQNIKFSFDSESLLIFAGGWKSFADEAIPIDEFKKKVYEYLGIPSSNIRDIYGFVEHGIPYMTCEKDHFHVPVYSRVYSREPGTLRLLGEGEKGLLHVLTPYNIAQPNLSVLSTDYIEVRNKCDCGRRGQIIILRGRAGKKKHSGCSITALELLNKK